MITAEKLNTLINYRAPELTRMAKENGYAGPAFSSCKFLGITNGGELCYMAVFLVEGGTDSTKVYINHRDNKVTTEVVDKW
jgi:hypothetical protein